MNNQQNKIPQDSTRSKQPNFTKKDSSNSERNSEMQTENHDARDASNTENIDDVDPKQSGLDESEHSNH